MEVHDFCIKSLRLFSPLLLCGVEKRGKFKLLQKSCTSESFLYYFPSNNSIGRWISTDSTKINRPGHSIHMYWTNFRQPTAHVQKIIFWKTSTEVCSPHLYASFGTFYTQIGQLFQSQCSESLKYVWKSTISCLRRKMSSISECSNTVSWIIDQFGRKRCQKKHKDVDYKLL